MATVDLGSWENRRDYGDRVLAELREKLFDLGFRVADTGQEKFLTNAIHSDLRKVHDDLTVRALRFQPDLMIYRDDFPATFFECMGCQDPHYPYYTLEEAKYLELISRAVNKQRCVLSYKQEWSGIFVASWVTDIRLDVDKTGDAERQQARGSRTPYYLTRRSRFIRLEQFIDRNKTRPAVIQTKLF